MLNSSAIHRSSVGIESYFVKSIWKITEYNPAQILETILLKGTAEIIFNLSDSVIYGNASAGIEMKLPECFINGINFKPFTLTKCGQQEFLGIQLNALGLKVLFNTPTKEFNNAVLDAQYICKNLNDLADRLYTLSDFESQAKAIMDWIRSRLAQSNEINAISQAHRLFYSPELNAYSVSKLSNEVEIYDRHLRRIAADWLGMKTQAFISYTRYLYALQMLHHSDISLTQVGLNAGYYDQAHFIRDFKSFTDISPKEYRSANKALPGHIIA